MSDYLYPEVRFVIESITTNWFWAMTEVLGIKCDELVPCLSCPLLLRNNWCIITDPFKSKEVWKAQCYSHFLNGLLYYKLKSLTGTIWWES
jgi:hypothetical protein